jgi:hypothetical protein
MSDLDPTGKTRTNYGSYIGKIESIQIRFLRRNRHRSDRGRGVQTTEPQKMEAAGGRVRWCVVTGGRGFAARHLVTMLLHSGEWRVRVADLAPVIVLDRDEEEGILGAALREGRAAYASADLRDKAQVARGVWSFLFLLPRSSGRLRISGRRCCGSRSILVGVGSGDHPLHFRSELLMGSIISFVMAPFALQDGTSVSLTNLRWTHCYILTLVSVVLITLVHFICIALCHGFCLLGASPG